MAQIDPSIAMGFRPPQIESPINQMAAMAQLQGLRQQQEQNALKLQEYQQLQQEQNALAKLYGDRSLEFGSDEFLRRAAIAAPRSFEGIATRAAQRENLLAQKEAREAETQKRQFESEKLKGQLSKENYQTAVGEILGYESLTDVVNDIYQKEVAGEITPQQAAALRAKLPKDDAGLDSWRIATMRGLLPPKEQYAEIKAKQDETYNNYRVSEIFAGRVPLSRENYERQTAPVATPVDATAAPAAAPAAAPVDATAAPAEATTAADGTKTFSGVTKVGTKQGFDYLDLTAQQLLQLAATAKTDKEAAAYKAAAEKIQAAHVKALEDQQKRGQLTGEFFNVELARQKVQALKKLPSTPDIVEQINDLLAMIKTAKEGKAPKVSVGVKLPEGVKAVDQKYAQDYLDWSQGGGADAAANMGQIKSVLDRLASGEALTGKSVGLAPDFFNALVNPEALGAKQQVEEVVQRNLRAVLGAQFTQVEGERLISRAFDARLSPQENVKRLRKLFMQMQTAAQQKQAMAEYYEANETLRGYRGKQPKMQDFYDALSTPDAPPKGSVDVKGPDGKTYRFPDKKSADEFRKSAGIKE